MVIIVRVLISIFVTYFLCCGSSQATTLIVNSNGDNPNPPYLTLREAIERAGTGDNICFDPSLSGQVITLTQGTLRVSRAIDINASTLSKGITVDARGAFTVFQIRASNPSTVSMTNITVTGGRGLGAGGIDSGVSRLTLTDCSIVHNVSTNGGVGGIWSVGPGSLVLVHSRIEGNESAPSSSAAGIRLTGNPISQATLLADSCSFSNNMQTAIVTQGRAAVNLNNCDVSHNQGSGFSANGLTSTSSVIITNSIMQSNRRNACIIDIQTWTPQVRISGCRFSENSYNGGYPAVTVSGPDAVNLSPIFFTNCEFSNNQASAMVVRVARVQLDGCNVLHNLSNSKASILNQGHLTLNYCTVSGNIGYGGGIVSGHDPVFPNYGGTTRIIINNSTISSNHATHRGGGLYVINAGAANGTYAELRNSTITGNHSAGDGGGIWVSILQANHRVYFDCINSTITNNAASGSGGGVFLQAHPGVVFRPNNSIIAGNSDSNRLAPDVRGWVSDSRGYNLIGNVAGSDGWSEETDLTGDPSEPLDPLLGKLADNGGPTLTHALQAGSPAINTGNPAFVGTIDQRGAQRDNTPDRGSFEYGSLPPPRRICTLTDP